jgi:FMN phosphatase YigB (HAD superfamily)/ASC-1-like (ASCH) protein
MAVSQVKTLWVREPYLKEILAGRKTVEVRVGYENIRRLKPDDRLKLNDRHLVTIRRIGRYANFEELMAHEAPEDIAPGLAPQELLAALREIYPPEKESLGAIALEVALPRRYDAIFFDMGYTLVYFDPLQELIVQGALRAVGVMRSEQEILTAVQEVWGDYYRDAETVRFPATEEYDKETQTSLGNRLLARLGVPGDAELHQQYLGAIEREFGRPGVLRPYPEIMDVLDILQAEGYRLGIVSNWSWNLRSRVEQVGLDGYFEVVWGSAYAGCNKPHACIFQQALARMAAPAVAPDRALYVGDSYEHDVRGARNAGLDVVLLDRDGVARNPDCHTISDLRGLFGMLGG